MTVQTINPIANRRDAHPDPLAVAVADAVQHSVAPAQVILFGSRARGDHRPDSDVDLLIVAGDSNAAGPELRARFAAREYLTALESDLGVDVVAMTRSAFNRARLANQHVAGQAFNHGIIMCNDNLDWADPEPDGFPDHWPETVRRLQTVEEWLYHVNDMLQTGSGPQRILGFGAQQAVENALKAWLSTHNLPRNYGHELTPLWDEIRSLPETSAPDAQPAVAAVANLFAYTRYEDPDLPGIYLDWLSKYAVDYRYAGVSHQMKELERAELRNLLNAALSEIVALVHRRSGTTSADVWPDGERPW